MSTHHYVYIIAHLNDSYGDKPVKVGITSNLDGRLKALQTGNSRRLSYVMTLTMPDRHIAEYMERAFHDLQKDKRLAGEWFDIEVREAMALLGLYFDIAIQLNIGDEDDEDGLAKAVREHSGLNSYRRMLGAQQ